MKHDIELAKELGMTSGTECRKLKERYGIRMRGRRIINFDFNRTTVAQNRKFWQLIRPKRIPTDQIVYIAPERIGPRNWHGSKGDTFQHLVIHQWQPRREYDEAAKKFFVVEGQFTSHGVLNLFIKSSDAGLVGLEVLDLGISSNPKRDRMPTPQFVAPNKNFELQREETDIPIMSGTKDEPIKRPDGSSLCEWLRFYEGHYGRAFSRLELIKDRLLRLEEGKGKYEDHLDVLIIGDYEVQEKDIW